MTNIRLMKKEAILNVTKTKKFIINSLKPKTKKREREKA
jgi:hypothetical protein